MLTRVTHQVRPPQDREDTHCRRSLKVSVLVWGGVRTHLASGTRASGRRRCCSLTKPEGLAFGWGQEEGPLAADLRLRLTPWPLLVGLVLPDSRSSQEHEGCLEGARPVFPEPQAPGRSED